MTTLTSTPGALRILGSSVIARLPLAMLGIALLVHARHVSGSFAAAGLVAGAYAVAAGDREQQLHRLTGLIQGQESGSSICTSGT